MLLNLTLVVNFVGLVIILWLGLYIVTRSPRSLIAWLTCLTSWSIAGLFLNILLALNPPPALTDLPLWLRLFFPFWPAGALARQEVNGWLQGWSVTLAVVLWHHATVLMRPGPVTLWRWVWILLGYGAAAAAVYVQAFTPFFLVSISGSPLYLNTLKAGPLYPIFAFFLLLYTGMSITNLVRSAQAASATRLRKQLNTLAIATVVGGLSGPLSITASVFGLPTPMVILSLLLGIAVVLTGYGVARYSALIDGRTIQGDFIYHAAATSLVILFYLLATWISVRAYNVPAVAFVFVVILAIISHSLVDVARQGLDFLFYQRETRRLRNNLRRLTRRAGEKSNQSGSLALALDSICTSVQATFGLIVVFEDDDLRLAATYRWPQTEFPLSPSAVAADDFLFLEPGHWPPPLAEAALLIPSYGETEQLGALILGQPVNSPSYSQADVELLLYPSDWVADMLQQARREAEYMARLAGLVERSQAEVSPAQPTHISVEVVETALRRLPDYAQLGQSPLTRLKLVKSRLPAGTVTHLDRGRAVYYVLAEVIEELRPEGKLPGELPPREWYPYLILHDAYLADIPNREIMARLYISEGTFSRTRRAALRAVARTLEEMEAATR